MSDDKPIQEQIGGWLKNHKWFTIFSLVWVVGETIWMSDGQFRNVLMKVFEATPRWLHDVITGILIPILVWLGIIQQKKTTPAGGKP